MDRTINIKVTLENLPETPNCGPLAVQLEAEVNDAVARALNRAYDDSSKVTWDVHVPSF